MAQTKDQSALPILEGFSVLTSIDGYNGTQVPIIDRLLHCFCKRSVAPMMPDHVNAILVLSACTQQDSTFFSIDSDWLLDQHSQTASDEQLGQGYMGWWH